MLLYNIYGKLNYIDNEVTIFIINGFFLYGRFYSMEILIQYPFLAKTNSTYVCIGILCWSLIFTPNNNTNTHTKYFIFLILVFFPRGYPFLIVAGWIQMVIYKPTKKQLHYTHNTNIFTFIMINPNGIIYAVIYESRSFLFIIFCMCVCMCNTEYKHDMKDEMIL